MRIAAILMIGTVLGTHPVCKPLICFISLPSPSKQDRTIAARCLASQRCMPVLADHPQTQMISSLALPGLALHRLRLPATADLATGRRDLGIRIDRIVVTASTSAIATTTQTTSTIGSAGKQGTIGTIMVPGDEATRMMAKAGAL